MPILTCMDDIISELYKRIPYYSTLGFDVKEVRDGRAIFELELRKELTQNGSIHGGALASMVDSSCTCAAYSLTFPQAFITTIDLQVQFLKPVYKGKIKAVAHCLKAGKRVCFCESKIWDEGDNLVCTGTSQLLKISSK